MLTLPRPAVQVEALLERGADSSARDKQGLSTMHFAAAHGQLEVARFLWTKGVELDSEGPGDARSPQLAHGIASLTRAGADPSTGLLVARYSAFVRTAQFSPQDMPAHYVPLTVVRPAALMGARHCTWRLWAGTSAC